MENYNKEMIYSGRKTFWQQRCILVPSANCSKRNEGSRDENGKDVARNRNLATQHSMSIAWQLRL